MARKIVVKRKVRAAEQPQSQDRYKDRWLRDYARIQAKREKGEKLRASEQPILEGKTFVSLCISVDLWWRFVDQRCKEKSPNAVVTAMIEEVVK